MKKERYPIGDLIFMAIFHFIYLFLYYILFELEHKRLYGYFYINMAIYFLYLFYIIYLSMKFDGTKESKDKLEFVIYSGFFIMVFINFFACVGAFKLGLD